MDMDMELEIEQNADRIGEFRADGHVYKLLQELELTAFSKVYLAVETRENKLVYLHVSEDGESPQKEFKAMEELKDCPYFVKAIRLHESGHLLHFSGEERPGAALAMEYCGTNLFQLIRCSREAQATSRDYSQYYFRQLVLALEALQEKKIIHGDLKPSNIYIGGGRHLKVGRFRNCAFGDEAKGNRGTKGHQAPEITSSPDRKYNNKVDIFSAGVTFFNMLCGYDPFYGQRGKTDISDKREFWKSQFRYFKYHLKRGVMQVIVEGTADELYSATRDIRYPIILAHEEEAKLDSVVCYSFAELKESVSGKSNKALKFAVYRFVAMDLIDGMLEIDPERRWNIDRIKSHEFFNQRQDFPYKEIYEGLKSVYGDETNFRPFFRAAASGDLNSLQFMTKGFLDLDGLDLLHHMEDPKGSGNTLLHAAARSGKLNVVKYLVERFEFDPYKKDNESKTPLDLAISSKRSDVVKYLQKVMKLGDKKEENEEKEEKKNGGLPIEAMKRLYSSTTPWRRSRLMIVGKGKTGKTTLYMALKGEEFRVPDSTIVADVTVQDVSAGAATAAFSEVKMGGNLERALGAIMKGQQSETRNTETDNNEKPAAFEEKSNKTEHSVEAKRSKAARFEDCSLPPPDSEETERLCKKLNNWHLDKAKDDPEAMRVSVWDFGGQKVFYTSHVMFLNRNCLYMVVFSLAEFLGRESNGNGNTAEKQREDAEEFLRIWLQNIRTFAPGAPIIFVGTKIDELEEYNDPEELLDVLEDVDEKITDIAREIFEGSQSYPWSRCKQWRPDGAAEPADLIFFPANSKYRSSDGEVHGTVVELRRQVIERFQNDEKANEAVPAVWTKVCDDLIAKNKAIFTIEAIKEECRKHKIENENVVRLMLGKYHELGLAMYFYEDGLKDYIVWQPQHLIDLVKKLIFDRRLHRRAKKSQELALKHAGEVKKYLETGVIHEAVLRHLWQEKTPEDEKEDSKARANGLEQKKKLYDFGRNMLQKFLMLCKIGGTEKYLVPSMMTKSRAKKTFVTAVSKFFLHFTLPRPHSYYDILIGNIVTELSSNTERTKQLRGGDTSPFQLEKQFFDLENGKAELYLEPVHFRVSTSMQKKDRGGNRLVMRKIYIEILSDIKDSARILQFILEIANGIRAWPYQNSDATKFCVFLFDRTMTHTVKYEKWQNACDTKKTKVAAEKIATETTSMIEMAKFRFWEPFYELFSKHHTLRRTFDFCDRSSGNDSKEVILLETAKKTFEQLYPSESAQDTSQRMKSLPESAMERGGITFEEYVELVWVERGSLLREAKSASDFDARLEAWVRPLTSEEVPAHLAFTFALPLNNLRTILELEKDGEMMDDMTKVVRANGENGDDNKDCQLHMSRWRASKENVSTALRSNCFALLVGCHCTSKHGLEFEDDVPGGKAAYVTSKEFSKMIMEAKKTPRTCSLKILLLAACQSEAVAQELIDLNAVDHVIVCEKNKFLGDVGVRIFQTVFFDRLLRGATVSTSFEAAKQKLKDMANTFIERSKAHETHTSQYKSLVRKAENLTEEVDKYLLLPKDGNHNVRFSFKPYSPPHKKLESWLPALPGYFHPAPFLKQLKWAVEHYLQLQLNLFTAVQRDKENSARHRWVQLTGPSKVGKTSAAKYIAWRLKLYDIEGPDGIFWVQGGKGRDDVMENFMKALPDMKSMQTEKPGKIDHYERIKRFFIPISRRPVLMIIDGADNVKGEDGAKLFKDLMDLSPRLHILTTSTNPIQLQGFDSNKEDLKLRVWSQESFKTFFKMRAHDFGDSKFSKLVYDGIRAKHFRNLYASEHFKESNKHKNPQTAFLLVQEMCNKCTDVDDAKAISSKPHYLVDVLNELMPAVHPM